MIDGCGWEEEGWAIYINIGAEVGSRGNCRTDFMLESRGRYGLCVGSR